MASREQELEEKLQKLTASYEQLQANMAHMEEQLVKKIVARTVSELNQQRDPLKREVLKRFSRKRRELVKSKIKELIAGRSIELAELKDLIVDSLAYCSKASFYRYMDELKAKGVVELAAIDNRQVVSLLAEARLTL